MATMALPIRELEHSVIVEAEEARAKTECVATYSKAKIANLGTACRVAAGTIGLKWLFGSLVRQQQRLIAGYQAFDFAHCSDEVLADLTNSLDGIVERDRALLEKANSLGTEIRVWWGASLRQLAEQAEHLDSIAQSLHLECEPEASLLLAMAVEQFSAEEVAQLAMK
jgi:hypothetical protein